MLLMMMMTMMTMMTMIIDACFDDDYEVRGVFSGTLVHLTT